ncbi:MAG: hypothetical protein MUF86_05085, partial [Akkermansiaceae bacterium]|nr:hypothetical protein [Akkermansiaceae bacterium]
MRTTFLVSPIIALTALANVALGLTPISDNFDDDSLDNAKWDYFPYAGGSIAESGGKINYIVSTPATDGDGDAAELGILTNPGSSENWQVIVDVTNTTSPNAVGKISSVGIQIYIAADFEDLIFLELYSSAL